MCDNGMHLANMDVASSKRSSCWTTYFARVKPRDPDKLLHNDLLTSFTSCFGLLSWYSFVNFPWWRCERYNLLSNLLLTTKTYMRMANIKILDAWQPWLKTSCEKCAHVCWWSLGAKLWTQESQAVRLGKELTAWWLWQLASPGTANI